MAGLRENKVPSRGGGGNEQEGTGVNLEPLTRGARAWPAYGGVLAHFPSKTGASESRVMGQTTSTFAALLLQAEFANSIPRSTIISKGRRGNGAEIDEKWS